MKNKYTFLQPSFYKDFKCSGSSCKFNCCNYSWNIPIDKETYFKYKKIKEPEYFVELLNKTIKKNKNNPSDVQYAKLTHKKIPTKINYTNFENGNEKSIEEEYAESFCPLQDNDNLCMVHKYLGEDSLCFTCRLFPRVHNNIFNNYERSMTIGCEEVSKLLYALKNGIIFEVIEEDYYEKYPSTIDLSKNTNSILYYFDDIRLICLELLQLREYSLDDRMIFLSILMFKIDELSSSSKYNEIPEYLNNFFNNIPFYKNSLNINTQNHNLVLTSVSNSMLNTINLSGNKEIFLIFRDLLFNIEKSIFELNNSKEKTFSNIYNDYKKIRYDLMKDKEYFIENIFVNLFFYKALPYNGINSIKECCIIFVFYYIIYKTLLANYLYDKPEASEDLLHKMSTIFGRMFCDQYSTDKVILSILKSDNIDNLANLILSIKSS
ncbi:flagellin lysine-N-methylase [uncultured Tyzzerella sp.]|uniref:flagellin lysine-N-methylase n=1 Tax=uncultured Tyzzerella sp. TaxID=2321398 RepID=UPI0029422336|nr:flagellin lysine-N-methylase [uncultured Tyzzerella sp.]